MKNKAVVLGANYYIGLSIIRSLGKNGIEVVAIDYGIEDRYAFESKYVSQKLIAPDFKQDPDGYIDFLIQFGKKQTIKPVLFPSADPYVEIIDKYMDELKPYYLFNMTQKGLWTSVLNKESLEKLAKQNDVLVPETISSNDPELLKKVNEVIKYPCLVKPTDSPKFVNEFRKKLFKVFNDEELIASIKKANEKGLEVIIQRMIPGFDDHMYTFDAYMNQDSEITHWTTCQKYRQYPINFGASVYTGQKYVPELFERSARFFKNIGYKGFAEIEYKKDSITGEYYFIEVNARTTNLNSLLLKVGLNFPLIAYNELTNNSIDKKVIDYDTNYVFWYAYEDLFAIRDYIKTGQLKLSEIIKSFRKKKAYSIWLIEDPKPYFSFIKKVFIKVIKKVLRIK
jgi:predicted ATP-grasp superfamily ATP-dependent carboligase